MSQSSKTSAPSMQPSCETLELFPNGSLPAGPAKTSAARVRDTAWTAHALDYGRKSPVWLASWESKDSSWRTAQTSLQLTGELTSEPFSETWPRSGMMRSGTAYRLPPLTHPTSVIASGSSQLLPTPTCAANMMCPSMQKWPLHRNLWPTPHGFSADGKTNGPSGNELGRAVNQHMWPTPTASAGGQDTAAISRGKSLNLAAAVKVWPTPRSTDGDRGGRGELLHMAKGAATPRGMLPTPTASRRSGLQSHGQNVILGSLNPDWVEWLQGLPIGWTASAPSET